MFSINSVYNSVVQKLNKIRPVAPDENAKLIANILSDKLQADLSLTQASIIFYFLTEKPISIDELSNYFDNQTITYVNDSLNLYFFLKDYNSKLLELLRLPADSRNRTKNINNLRKFIVSVLEDFRSLFILGAYFLYLLEIYYSLPKETQIFIRTTIEIILSPLAHRLGFYGLKKLFDDLLLKQTEPEIYSRISNYIEQLKLKSTFEGESEFNFKTFKHNVQRLLEKNISYPFIIKGRIKSVASIYRKMRLKNKELEKLKDIFAIRIILQTPSDPKEESKACWNVYNLIIEKYELKPNTIKDYISRPKPNGYQSLHFTVFAPGQIPVEVQVRTARMDEIAEKGDAAHWIYKEAQGQTVSKDETFLMLRKIIDQNQQIASSNQTFTLKNLLNEIYVFTPNQDIINLPKGATVLDFAYAIHTSVGEKCTGAIISPWLSDKTFSVNYKYQLSNGSTVKILTNPQQEPKLEWLNIVVTKNAKKSIKSYIKLQQIDSDISVAKEALERRLNRLGYSLADPIFPKLIELLGYNETYKFYSDIASGKIDLTKIKNYIEQIELKQLQFQNKTPDNKIQLSKNTSQIPTLSKILVGIYENNSVKILSVKPASCCQPRPGDKIAIYISKNTASLHKADCPNLLKLKNKYPSRVYKAIWIKNKKHLSLNNLAKNNTIFAITIDTEKFFDYLDPKITIKENIKKFCSSKLMFNPNNIIIQRKHNTYKIYLLFSKNIEQKHKRFIFQTLNQQPWAIEVKERKYNPNVAK